MELAETTAGRLSMRRILLTSVAIYTRRPLLYVIVAGCVVTIYDVIAFVFTSHRPFGPSPEKLSVLSVSGGAGLMFVMPVVAALYAYIVSMFRHVPTAPQVETGVSSLRVLPGVLASLVVAYLGIGVAGIFFVLPGLLLWLRWFVVAPIVAVERRGILGALKRSAQLTTGYYLRVLGLLLTLWAVVLIAAFCIHVVFAGYADGAGVVAVEVVVQGLIVSYLSLTIAVLYFDLSAHAPEL